MEIFVKKTKVWKRFPGTLLPKRVIHYNLVFTGDGECKTTEFVDKGELIKYLINEKIYKDEEFPYEIVSANQFIEKGFSIYYYQ